MEHTYKMMYEFELVAGKFSKEDIKASGKGGCDAFVIYSVIYPDDGSLSIQTTSFDGRNGGGELSSKELFKFWLMLGMNLSEKEDLDDFRKELAAMPIDTFAKAMGITKKGEENSQPT